jgi:hypothetical protein
MLQPGHYASIAYAVNPVAGASPSVTWTGLPGKRNGEIPNPTFPNLGLGSPYYAFTWPTFIQYAPGHNTDSLARPNPDKAGIARGDYIYSVGADQAYGNSSHILLARIPSARVLSSLGGDPANIVAASNWQYYDFNNSGCPTNGDGTNRNCWVSSAAKATPIASLPLLLGMPSMQYLPGPNRYILVAFNWTPLAGQNAGSISNQKHFSVWGEFIYFDCAHPWGEQPGQCQRVGTQDGYWTSGATQALGYYSAAFMPPAPNNGYRVNVLGAGNFNGDKTWTSASVYGPTEWQLTLHF